MLKKTTSIILSFCLAVIFLPKSFAFAEEDATSQENVEFSTVELSDATTAISGPLELKAKIVDQDGNAVSGVRFGLYKSGSNSISSSAGSSAYGMMLKEYDSDAEGILSIKASDARESFSNVFLSTKKYPLIKTVDSQYKVKKISIKNEQRSFERSGNLPLYLGVNEKMTSPRTPFFEDFAFDSYQYVNLDSNTSQPREMPIQIDTEVVIEVEKNTSVYKDSLQEIITYTGSYKAEDYAQGYDSFKSAYDEGKTVLENTAATQTEVDEAVNNLNVAMEGLVAYPATTYSQFNAVVLDESGKYFSGSQTFIAYELDDEGNPTDTIIADDIKISEGILSVTPALVNYKNVLVKLKENNKYTTNNEFKIYTKESSVAYFDDSRILSVNGVDVPQEYGQHLNQFAVYLSLKSEWIDPGTDGVPKGQAVTVADIPVEYTDGSVVEDGFTIDFYIPNPTTSKLEHSFFEVKDGKIAGFSTVSGYEVKASIEYTNQKYGAYGVVGIDGVLSMFGRYQGKLPLVWSAIDGADGTEQTLEKIQIKKAPTRDESTNANKGMSLGEGVDTRYDEGDRPDAFDTTYNTLDVTLQTLPIRCDDGSGVSKSLKFNFFDATTQQFEQTAESLPGLLSYVNLKKDHHYIVYLEDDEYEMKNMYFTLNSSSVEVYPIDDKTDQKIQQVTVSKKATPEETSDVRRKTANFTIGYKQDDGSIDYTPYFGGVKFTFTSEYDTQEVTMDGSNNKISVDLIEDIQYMVNVESDKYTIDSFPIAMKNHDEIPYTPVLPYNHFICGNVFELDLIAKDQAHKNDSPITSVSGKTTVSGLNFMTSSSNGNYLLNDRILGDVKVNNLEGEDYEVLDFDMVNLYRNGELSKLACGDFTVQTQVQDGKNVRAVYELASDGSTNRLKHSQQGNVVTFATNSMTINNYVVVYGEEPALTFIDVTEDTYHAGSINWMAEKGITKGWATDSGYEFRPYQNIARCDMAAFIYRLAGSPEGEIDESVKPMFSDVTEETPHCEAIWWMASKGITTGFSDGTFRPLDNIARCDMAAFLYRFAGQPTDFDRSVVDSLVDINSETYHYDAIAWLAAAGITKGFPDGTFRPLDNIVRCDMAAFIQRTHDAIS